MRYNIRRSDNRIVMSTELKSIAVLSAAYLSTYDETSFDVIDTRYSEIVCNVMDGVPNEITLRDELHDTLKSLLSNLTENE